MKGRKIPGILIGMILCFLMINPGVNAKEVEGYREYKIENVTVSFPDEWNVMYEGNADLEKIYTMYHLDSYDSWKNYMESKINNI